MGFGQELVGWSSRGEGCLRWIEQQDRDEEVETGSEILLLRVSSVPGVEADDGSCRGQRDISISKLHLT